MCMYTYMYYYVYIILLNDFESIINKESKEYELKRNTPVYKFLFKMQEEVHRFAIDFHRKSRTNELFLSELDSIPGLGIKRKKLLLDKIGSV